MELIKPNIWDLNWEILLSIFVSLICGMILGIEREISNKWAGIRTHMLVCLGSCIFTILSIYGFPIFSDPANIHSSRFGDPTRIAAQILTGIGFIGGGTVLRHGTSIFGLTTAATLWVSAAIGMACACKMYLMVLLVTPLVVCVLVLIRLFEKRFLHLFHSKQVELKFCATREITEVICNKLKDIASIKKIQTNVADEENNQKTEVCTVLQLKSDNPIEYLYSELAEYNCRTSILIREINEKN